MAAWISATVRARGSGRGRLGVEAVEHLFGQGAVQRPAAERAEGHHADQSALERTDVAVHARGDHLERLLLGELDVVVVGALAQDRQARRGVRRVDVGDQAGREALAQAVLERLQIAAAGGRR